MSNIQESETVVKLRIQNEFKITLMHEFFRDLMYFIMAIIGSVGGVTGLLEFIAGF